MNTTTPPAPQSHTARLIDGRAMAARVRADVAAGVATLNATRGVVPGLAVILIGNDPASTIYVANKITACAQVGMASTEHHLPETASMDDALALIAQLNADAAIHGILLQLPLPAHLDTQILINAIHPDKDVDGLHPVNAGRLMNGLDGLFPCTPTGCMMMLQDELGSLAGLNAIMIGSSILCGRPMGQMLLRAQATVIQCHSKTRDLPALCRQADIVVVAVGRPHLVRGDWVKAGATVIDIGINRMPDGHITGDVAFDEVAPHARAITPVPGGVGPMTIACLLKNTLQAAQHLTA